MLAKKHLPFFIYLILFSLVSIISCNYLMSYWFFHVLIAIFAFLKLKKVSHYSLTWLFIIIAFLFSSQTRFSLEAILINLGILAWVIDSDFKNLSKKHRGLIILIIILINTCFSLIGKNLNESYGLLAWLPVLISLYFPLEQKELQKKNFLFSILTLILSILVSKLSLVFSLCSQYLSVIKSKKNIFTIFAIAITLLISTVLLKGQLNQFYKKSINPRIIILKTSFNGFLAKPIFGNGFASFPIEINGYRAQVNSIGGKIVNHINHAHNSFSQIAFEQGLLGLALLAYFFYFLWGHNKTSFYCLLFASSFDSIFVYSNQYLVFFLLFIPDFFTHHKKLAFQNLLTLPVRYRKFASHFLLFISLILFSTSCIGHFFYDQKSYTKALKFDDHPLYHFFYAAKLFEKMEFDKAILFFQNSINLAKNHGYQQGFLASSFFMAKDLKNATKWMDEAIQKSGDSAHWQYIGSMIYAPINTQISEKYKTEALNNDPNLLFYEKGVQPPKLKYYGLDKSLIWVNSYQRRGDKIYLPVPIK